MNWLSKIFGYRHDEYDGSFYDILIMVELGGVGLILLIGIVGGLANL